MMRFYRISFKNAREEKIHDKYWRKLFYLMIRLLSCSWGLGNYANNIFHAYEHTWELIEICSTWDESRHTTLCLLNFQDYYFPTRSGISNVIWTWEQNFSLESRSEKHQDDANIPLFTLTLMNNLRTFALPNATICFHCELLTFNCCHRRRSAKLQRNWERKIHIQVTPIHDYKICV